MSLNRFKSFFATMALLGISVGFDLTTAHAEQIKLSAALAKPTMLAGEKALNYLKVKLTGFDLPKAAMRPPVNIAIVLDRSGSMKGEKIQHAKRAALAAVDRLRDDDIVSVVTYDTNVRVLVPATRASDRDSIRQAIESIQADGNTALFAGVSKGAAEVRKFLDDKHVNRIIVRAALAAALLAPLASPALSQQPPSETENGAANLALVLIPAKGGAKLTVTSPAFKSGSDIPFENTQYRGNAFPGLTWTAGPAGTKAYAIIMQDGDSRGANPILHWVMFNIPTAFTTLTTRPTAS